MQTKRKERSDTGVDNERLIENQFIVGTMTYSFSRLSSFYQCKREWKKRYIDCEQGTDSAMGQFGSFCHKILELYSKGYLSIFELSSYYEDHYNEEVNIPFPNNNYVDLSKNYYDSGLNYFNNFNTEYNNIYNILGVEKEVKFNINNYDMICYIDYTDRM